MTMSERGGAVKTLLGVLSITAVLVVSNVSAQGTTAGPERSYNATKELVWNAVVETLSELGIVVKKADKNKGDIQSESELRASEYYSCELHDKRGRAPREGFWVKGSKGKLVASIKEPSSGHTSLQIQLERAKQGVDLGGYTGRLECQSTGKLEDTVFQRVEARLAGAK